MILSHTRTGERSALSLRSYDKQLLFLLTKYLAQLFDITHSQIDAAIDHLRELIFNDQVQAVIVQDLLKHWVLLHA